MHRKVQHNAIADDSVVGKSKNFMDYGWDIKKLFVESAISNLALSMPVSYLIMSDVGLNQTQIGLLAATYSMAMIFLEVPTGYLADKFSPKISNALGDFVFGVGLLGYVFADGFIYLLIAEIVLGAGSSMTNGADAVLMKAHSEREGLDYGRVAARLTSVRFVSAAAGAILGGLLGSVGIRWPMVIQAGLLFAAGLLALTIRDAGKRRVSDKHPIKDVWIVTKYCLHGHPSLARRILLASCLMVSTWLMVWFMTPVMLEAGIDVSWQGLVLSGVGVFAFIGSEYVARGGKMKITTPFLITVAAYLVLGWKIVLLTAPIFLMTSLARGINTARTKPYIQDVVPEDIQATSLSVYSVVYKVIGSALMLAVNFIGDPSKGGKLNYGLLAAGAVSLAFWLIFRLVWPEKPVKYLNTL